MPHITLAVTPKVLEQVKDGHGYQRQLAVRGCSDDVKTLIEQASKQNKVQVAVCGEIVLTVGDTGAIWGVHQQPGQQESDFADLYSLLARRPDKSVTFTW